jgi:hypothetical protein
MQYGPRRQVVEAFRGIGKSWQAATFAMFCLYHNPKALNIMVVSASKPGRQLRDFCYQADAGGSVPHTALPANAQRSSKTAFDVWGSRLAESLPLLASASTAS